MIKYYSDVTKEYYNSVKEAQEAERAYEIAQIEKKRAEEKARLEKEELIQELREAKENYLKLLAEYAEKYNCGYSVFYS